MMKYILTIIYMIFTTLGIALMKKGGDSISVVFKDNFGIKIGYITLLGFLCYIISFLLWQKLLVKFDLSYIVPITTGIIQIIIVIIGIFLFKENINIYNIIGILVIIIGIALLSIKN